MKKTKGFTLAELLIAVAIIGVLVAISIPIFSSQLEKSREATDLSNVRSAYSQVINAEISGSDGLVKKEQSGAYYLDVKLKQKQKDWQTSMPITIAGVSSTDQEHWIGTPNSDGACKVRHINGQTYLIWNGAALSYIEGVEFKTIQFWTQVVSDGTTHLEMLPNEIEKKNAISPVSLKAGDSFTVSKSCLIEPGATKAERIFAFYFAKETENKNIYQPILDSGWLDKNDLKTFTPVTTKEFVSNLDAYYSVETVANGIKFTVKEDMVLLINNTKTAAKDTVLNDVYVERAN